MTESFGVLVTGGAGFIGSALVRHLIRNWGVEVTVLDKLTYAGNMLNFGSDRNSELLNFIEGDVCDKVLVEEVFNVTRPKYVFHLAAESHVDRSIDGPSIFVETNVVGTANMLEAAHKYWKALGTSDFDEFRFIHVSTDEVYGSLSSEGYFTEESPYKPNSPYAATKAASDHLVRAWNKTYNLPTVTTNCANNFGPYQLPEKLVPVVIVNARDNKQVPIYGDGKQVRDWLYVDDHVEGLLLAARLGEVGETYGFGGQAEHTNLSIVHHICETLDRMMPAHDSHASLITHVEDRPGHDIRYAMDISKSRERLGWTPSTDFGLGIEKTVEWYLSNPDWINAVGTHGHARLGKIR